MELHIKGKENNFWISKFHILAYTRTKGKQKMNFSNVNSTKRNKPKQTN